MAAGGGEIVGWHCTKRGGKSADSETVLVRGYAKAESTYSIPMEKAVIREKSLLLVKNTCTCTRTRVVE